MSHFAIGYHRSHSGVVSGVTKMLGRFVLGISRDSGVAIPRSCLLPKSAVGRVFGGLSRKAIDASVQRFAVSSSKVSL
jgi:hypothetical protein